MIYMLKYHSGCQVKNSSLGDIDQLENELGDCWRYLAIGDGGLDEADNYGVGGK